MFRIIDETHGEPDGRFATFEEALAALHERAAMPWDAEPNRAPCRGWRTCHRAYAIIEYDDSQSPWRELQLVPVVDISASGVRWHPLNPKTT